MKKKMVSILLTAAMAASCFSMAAMAEETTEAAGGDTVQIAFVPQLIGIPYFTAMDEGGQRAAEDLGCEWIYAGDTTASADLQVTQIGTGRVSSFFQSLLVQKIERLLHQTAAVLPQHVARTAGGRIGMLQTAKDPLEGGRFFLQKAAHAAKHSGKGGGKIALFGAGRNLFCFPLHHIADSLLNQDFL